MNYFSIKDYLNVSFQKAEYDLDSNSRIKIIPQKKSLNNNSDIQIDENSFAIKTKGTAFFKLNINQETIDEFLDILNEQIELIKVIK